MMGAIAALGSAPAWTPRQVACDLAAAQTECVGLRISALEVSRRASQALDIGIDEVWSRLCDLPDNLLGLLSFPEGWTALVAIIAQETGQSPVRYAPSIH